MINPIESLRHIRNEQRQSGKDTVGYAASCAVASYVSAESLGYYSLPVAVMCGVMSFANVIKYNQCVTEGDRLQNVIINDIMRPVGTWQTE